MLAGGYIASGSVCDRIRARQQPSVARVLDAYGSMDSSAGSTEVGVSFGDTTAMRALDSGERSRHHLHGARAAPLMGVCSNARRNASSESWRRGAGVAAAHTTAPAAPGREESLRTIDAQIPRHARRPRARALLCRSQLYNITNGITGLKLAGGDFLDPDFMRLIAQRCAARHINLFWSSHTCRSESFVRPVIDENRVVRTAHGTWSHEQAMLLQMQTGLQSYFTASSSIAHA